MTTHPIDVPTAAKQELLRIETKGGVSSADAERLERRVTKLLTPFADRVSSANALLSIHHNHAFGAQARAQVAFNTRGETIRAEVHAPTIPEAIDAIESRLRRQIEQRTRRAKDDPRGRPHLEGNWRHGNRADERETYFPRPVDEREVVAHKTFATPDATLDEARWDRFLLDYDFYLFVDADSGKDSLLFLDEDEEQIENREKLVTADDAPSMKVEDALRWLDETGERFVFFSDVATGRAAVVYRRYDGHYGLLTPRLKG